MTEEFKEFKVDQSKKLEVQKMRSELENVVTEKMVDYEDIISDLKK